MDQHIFLNELDPGRMGIVIEILGGRRLCQKLQAMGIRAGTKVRRIAGAFLQGPVVIEVIGARFAIGSSMAKKIIVIVQSRNRKGAAPSALETN